MNPRATLRAYLGWCPGFESASRFLPNREVSNKRIAISAAVIIIAAMSTYAATEALLRATGFSSNLSLEVRYSNPVIREQDGHLYLAVTQNSISTTTEAPAISYVKLYFSELLPNGTLRDTITIAELNDLGYTTYDFFYSKDGTWMLVYNLLDFIPSLNSRRSSLMLTTSSDGKTWGTPTEVYVGDITTDQPTLLELPDGSLFLEFSVFNMTYGTPQGRYSLYSIQDGGAWSTAKWVPSTRGLDIGMGQEESAFIDSDGVVGVVWHESVYSPLDIGIEYSKLVNGSWSEPKPLTSDDIQIRGEEPKILYSANHGVYYLFTRDDQGSFSKVHVFFSSDWVHWESRGSFKSGDYTVTELANGDLGLVYQDFDNSNLYYTSSVDGASWSTPSQVEVVESAEVQQFATLNQRELLSFVAAIVVSFAVLVALIWLPGTRIFSKPVPELAI